MSKKFQKCPFCSKKYKGKDYLYSHVEKEHSDQIPKGMPVSQLLFNIRNKKDGGKCIMCNRPTNWNNKTERYERLCEREKCSDDFREMFKRRMMRTHGKTHLLDDPEQQKKMLQNRRISGTYVWANGHKTDYVGSYEKKFLEFMEHFIQWETPESIMMPAPFTIPYIVDGTKHFYIPDVYFNNDLNLVVEIKASRENNTHHYREREMVKELAKDRAMEKSKYNYIKVEDNNFKELSKFILKNYKK